MRAIEAVAAGLFLLGEMYFGVAVLEVKTTPWQNSWFSLAAAASLILIGPLACSLIWRLDSKNGKCLFSKIRRIEIVSMVVGTVGSVALMMLLINITFGTIR
jgi:uncharacterized membrane protein YeiB